MRLLTGFVRAGSYDCRDAEASWQTETQPDLVRFHRTPALVLRGDGGARDGCVNLSPKGLKSLKIMDERRIIWLSLSGSGNETAAHLADNDRMTLMFCAFAGEALILRVYGHARVFHPREPEWSALAAHFPPMAGARQVFDLVIDLVQTSCGSGVPFMDFRAERGTSELLPFYEAMSSEGLIDYWRRKNMRSIDGKPTGIFSEPGDPA